MNLIPKLDDGKTQKEMGYGELGKGTQEWWAWWDGLTQAEKDEYNARPENQAYPGFWN